LPPLCIGEPRGAAPLPESKKPRIAEALHPAALSDSYKLCKERRGIEGLFIEIFNCLTDSGGYIERVSG